MWGLRKALSKYGMSLVLLETSEALGNAEGGFNQGPEYDGLTQMILQLNTQQAFHWYGGTFNVSGLQIHGQNLSALNLGTLQTSSGIEADRSTRLWELWYDQKFDREGKFDVKLGQQSLDQEFMVSQNALVFVNTMFGWPMLPSADMPGGGPAYPLSSPDVRARARLASPLTLLAGVFSGTPVASSNGDPQRLDSSGTNFLWSGMLAIAELQYTYPSLGSMVYPGKKEPFARVYKLGAWYDTKRFADQRFDNSGLSLSNPLSTGVPQTHHGDYAASGEEIRSDPFRPVIIDAWQATEIDGIELDGAYVNKFALQVLRDLLNELGFPNATSTPDMECNILRNSGNQRLNEVRRFHEYCPLKREASR
jgi:porin